MACQLWSEKLDTYLDGGVSGLARIPRCASICAAAPDADLTAWTECKPNGRSSLQVSVSFRMPPSALGFRRALRRPGPRGAGGNGYPLWPPWRRYSWSSGLYWLPVAAAANST